ncbi:MAG: OmpA family protein [Beijerinckiaceae bacterium]|nr:OmpA family protein [Beijerinckiaceae bacterium]MCI0734708.1 OmpA family protein [Beijerinckiaceae bacterium]
MDRINIGIWAVCLTLAGGLASIMADIAAAQEQPSAAQIIEALKPKAGPGRGTRSLTGVSKSALDRRFINSLRNRQTRLISIEERTKAAEIAKASPNIDLEINFEYNSNVIGLSAVPVLVNLGTALRSGELKGGVFFLSGHTDAKGGEAFNQDLSERRADAVKRFLVEKFSLSSGNLIPIGYGKTKLKNAADPFAGENRRVQIVNTEVK